MSSDLRKPLATLAEIGGENQARADKFQGEVAEANARASAFGSLIGGFGGLVSNLGGGKAYQRYQLALALSDGGQSLSGIGGGDQSLSGTNF